jgi:hypothetical protein
MAASIQDSSPCQKRALIIGNDNYGRQCSKLQHSCNNANDLSLSLSTINFNARTFHDLNKQKMQTIIIEFSKTIQDGDVVLFYFSGHAYHVNQKNYLIPIDDTYIEFEKDLDDFAINFERQIARLVNQNPSGLTILIVDCDRAYSIKGSTSSKGKPKILVNFKR